MILFTCLLTWFGMGWGLASYIHAKNSVFSFSYFLRGGGRVGRDWGGGVLNNLQNYETDRQKRTNSSKGKLLQEYTQQQRHQKGRTTNKHSSTMVNVAETGIKLVSLAVLSFHSSLGFFRNQTNLYRCPMQHKSLGMKIFINYAHGMPKTKQKQQLNNALKCGIFIYLWKLCIRYCGLDAKKKKKKKVCKQPEKRKGSVNIAAQSKHYSNVRRGGHTIKYHELNWLPKDSSQSYT